MIQIKKFIVPPLDNNLYIVHDLKEAAIIDPSYISDEILNYIKLNNLQLKYILITHGHFDHILAVKDYLQIYNNNIKICMSKYDLYWLNKKNYPISIQKYITEINYFNIDIDLSNYNKKLIFDIQCINTPGHSKGSICFYLYNNNALFCGDLMFADSNIGRTDLIDSNYDDMLKSLQKISKLKKNIIIYPGHGDDFILNSFDFHMYHL